MTATTWWRALRKAPVILACLVTLPVPPPIPNGPASIGLSLPSPSVPSVLPSPTLPALTSPASSPPATPANNGGLAAPTQAAPSTPASVTSPAASPTARVTATHGVAIPFTAVYVASPLDVAMIGVLVTLPLLLLIWLYLFGRTFVEARRARDAQTRLVLAADLGLHPRDLTSMSTKSLFSLREKAAFDELTGVLRRAAGIGAAEREIARARRHKAALSVAFIDVDGLKEANDRQGHAAGDALLRGLVQALKDGLRGEDVVFRYGGDEFVCVLPDTTMKEARLKLGEIQQAAARQGVRICAGVAQLQRSDDVVSLFASADRDLYEFKTSRGQIVQMPPAGRKGKPGQSALG